MAQYRISDILSLTAEDLVKLTHSQAMSYYRQAKNFAEQRYQRAKASSQRELLVVELKVKPIPQEQIVSVSRGRLISKIRAYQGYLKTKQSTIQGSEQTRSAVIRRLRDKWGVSINKQNYDLFWDVYKATRQHLAESNVSSKYELGRKIEEIMDNAPQELSTDDLVNLVRDIVEPTQPPAGMEGDYDDDDAFTLQRNPFGK